VNGTDARRLLERSSGRHHKVVPGLETSVRGFYTEVITKFAICTGEGLAIEVTTEYPTDLRQHNPDTHLHHSCPVRRGKKEYQ